ncbi:T9SS type A sorting domain-containing protein, partial [candidate division KSB1 bacterium]
FSQWVSQSTGFSDTLRGIVHIWPVDENIVWALAYDGSSNDSVIQEFTKTTNGGTTWTPGVINGAAGFYPNTIFALNADTAWVTMYHPDNDGGRIMRTNNGGQTWTHQSTALYLDSLEAYPNIVYFWNANEGFSMGDPTNDYFEIYTTNNGGTLWTRVDSIYLPTLISGEYGYEGEFTVIGSTVFFGTSKGRVYKSNDKGHTWTAITTPLTPNGRARICEFKDTMNGIIADRSSNVFTMYSTTNGGSTWTLLTPTGNVYGKDLCYVKGTWKTYISTGSASGVSGASISYDGGDNWIDISGIAGTKYTALGFPNNLTGWAGQFSQSSTVGGIAKFVGNTVGLSQDAEIQDLTIYPNPSNGRFFIRLPENTSAKELVIYDCNGKMVYNENGQILNSHFIDLSQLSDGIYFVEMLADNEILKAKLVLLSD